jgi:hypothetical protein
VGSNDQILVADSSTSTGLAWKSNATPFAAGKNKIINGDFNIWQRGTSYTFNPTVLGGTYGAADRWIYWHNGSTAGTNTVSQQSFTAGTAPVAGYEGQFFQRFTTTTIGTGQTVVDAWQRIEDVRTLAGQTVTVSFWVKTSGSTTFDSFLEQQFGIGGSSAVATTVISNRATTSSWQRVSGTVTLPSISGKTIGTGNNLMLGIRFYGVANGATFDIWGVQVEAGSVATPFQTATGTLQGELAACQRYYFRITPGGNFNRFGMAQALSATTANAIVQFPVAMRIAPTALEQTGTAANYGVSNSSYGSILALTSVPAFDRANNYNASISITCSTGLTAGHATQFIDNNSSTAYLGWSAEL